MVLPQVAEDHSLRTARFDGLGRRRTLSFVYALGQWRKTTGKALRLIGPWPQRSWGSRSDGSGGVSAPPRLHHQGRPSAASSEETAAGAWCCATPMSTLGTTSVWAESEESGTPAPDQPCCCAAARCAFTCLACFAVSVGKYIEARLYFEQP